MPAISSLPPLQVGERPIEDIVRYVNRYLRAPMGGQTVISNTTFFGGIIGSELRFLPDNTIDIGNLGLPTALRGRPRTIYVGTSVVVGSADPGGTEAIRSNSGARINGTLTALSDIDVTGNLLAAVDGTPAFGQRGASRFGSAYLATRLWLGTAPTTTVIAGLDNCSGVNGQALSLHTPDQGFTGWEYAGSATNFITTVTDANQVSPGTPVANNNSSGTNLWSRCTNNLQDDNFDYSAVFYDCGFNVNPQEAGIYFLAPNSGTGYQLGEGLTLSWEKHASGNVVYYYRNAAGTVVDTSVVGFLSASSAGRAYLQAQVRGSTISVYAWRGTTGTIIPTLLGTVTMSAAAQAALRDGAHQRVGVYMTYSVGGNPWSVNAITFTPTAGVSQQADGFAGFVNRPLTTGSYADGGGLYIGNHGFSGLTQSEGLLIDDQSGSVGTSYALRTKRGPVQLGDATTLLKTLTVNGASTLTGAVTMASTLGVTGAATLSNNATVGSTLGVTGATTLSSTLHTVGAVTFDSTLSAKTTSIAGALNVTGASAIGTFDQYLITRADTSSGGIVHHWMTQASGTIRFGMGLVGTAGGSDAGADFSLWGYNDSGTLLGQWLKIVRKTGAATFGSTVSATQFQSTIATGTAPFVVASTTVVANLHATNSDQLGGTVAASYALLASPTFTGTPAAPTATLGTNTTQLATTAFVQSAIGAYTPPVTSVFGRTGAVVATTGDYAFSNISGTIASGQVSGSYTGITGVGTLAAGAVPASLVTAGMFGAGAYTFPSTLGVTTNFTASGNTHIFGANTAAPSLNMNGAAGNTRRVGWQSAGVQRWAADANTATESGSNAGSNFLLSAYDDTGTYIDSPITIIRAAAGTFTVNRPVSFASTLVVTGNITGNGGGTVLGSNTGGGHTLVINSAATGTRVLAWRTAGVSRWSLQTSGGETGSDAGSNLVMDAFTDAGVFIDQPLAFVRAAGGLITVKRPITTNQQIASTVASGTAPFVVASTDLVTNLNADLLDGQHGSYYSAWGNLTGTPTTLAGYGITNAVDTSSNQSISGIKNFTIVQVGTLQVGTIAASFAGGIIARASGGAIFELDNITGNRRYVLDLEGTESGSDVGSDLTITRYHDAGTINEIALVLTRSSGLLTVTRDIAVGTAGSGFRVKEGTNAKMGTAVLVGGTVVVSTTAVTANSRIFLQHSTIGGTPGTLTYSLVAGTSFTVTSTSGTDTSTINWFIVEPA